MWDVKEKPKMVERALLVGVYSHTNELEHTELLLQELGELVTTLEIGIVGSHTVKTFPVHSRFLTGTGQAEAILELAEELEADCIVFDNELSPSQQRNWESFTKMCVVDRQEIIIDIFSRRAQTKEAKLQVLLARLEYTMPRLTRAWSHLGRQGGGGGTGARGEGEQQIELDRRMLRKQIDTVRKELEHVKKVRATQRKTRQRTPVPNAAIVGYTNAGKSSLLRRMTGAEVLVADKLFATLDTTTRKIELPNGHPLLLTDTVGFVRKLPHKLVDAFKATLEEAVLSEFLIHVLDASNPEVQEFYETTLTVLEELGIHDKPMLTVFNKIDCCNEEQIQALKEVHPDALFISVHAGTGIDKLNRWMGKQLSGYMARLQLQFPYDRSDLVAALHEQGKVISTEYEDDHISVHALVPTRFATSYEEYLEPISEPS